MNGEDFLELSKRNIFHTVIKCKDIQDEKYVLNYAPWISTEFTDNSIIIKDICSKKLLFESLYEEVISFELLVCSRLMAIRAVPTKLFDLRYIIHFKNKKILHLESKNILVVLDVLEVLNKAGVIIYDPLRLEENIKMFTKEKEFYDFCDKNIDVWKREFKVEDPKVGDLI